MTEPWAVGKEAAAHLLHLAEVLDGEARIAARPGSTYELEAVAEQLRVLGQTETKD